MWVARKQREKKKQIERERLAALCLQRHLRGRIERRRFEARKEELRQRKASLVLQRAFWRKRAREHAKKRKYLAALGACGSCAAARPALYLELVDLPLCRPCALTVCVTAAEKELLDIDQVLGTFDD